MKSKTKFIMMIKKRDQLKKELLKKKNACNLIALKTLYFNKHIEIKNLDRNL